MIYLTILISVFNVFMWIVFLKKFKSLFSTEDIISSTRNELNKMIEDVNRNTARDLNLADAKIKALKSILSEAEKRIELLNSDLARKSMSGEFMNALNQNAAQVSPSVSRPSAAEAAFSGHDDDGRPAEVGFVAEEPEAAAVEDRSQYFSVARNPAEKYIQNQTKGASVKARAEEASDAARQPAAPASENVAAQPQPVPSSPSVSFSPNPIQAKRDLSQSVMDLYSQGMDVEFIATKLNTTTTEVQLIIDMNF